MWISKHQGEGAQRRLGLRWNTAEALLVFHCVVDDIFIDRLIYPRCQSPSYYSFVGEVRLLPVTDPDSLSAWLNKI